MELSGAGFSSSDITTFANCYGITLGNGQVSEVDIDGGGATGPNTVEAELDIETVLSLAPQANIEVYEGGASDGIYNVLSRIVSDDSAKIVSASWTNGCESYVGQSLQNSENTLLQAAAVDGQSVFVSTGDQGSEGCNVNGVVSAPTGSDPVAQVVDATTGTAYVANKSSNTVSVDSEGTTSNPSDFATSGSVTTGTEPDAISLDSSLGKVFVANATSSSLTTFATSTCNQTTTSGCASPTQILSSGDFSNPARSRRTDRRSTSETPMEPSRSTTPARTPTWHRSRSVLERAVRARRRHDKRIRLRGRRRQRPGRVLRRLDMQREHDDGMLDHAGHGVGRERSDQPGR